MDRPEWIASNPFNAEIYCSLTNNKNRGIKKNLGGKEMPNLGPNPREKTSLVKLLRLYLDKWTTKVMNLNGKFLL